MIKPHPHIAALHPYVPGDQPQEGGWIKLNTNECPFPPSPRVEQAVAGEVARLRLYPNPGSADLREALAKHHGVDPAQVIVGNGSDDILSQLMRAYSGPASPTGYMVPSYSLYPVLAATNNTPVREIQYDRSMELDAEVVAHSGASLFFLTSPNAPTGVAIPTARIAEILATFEGIFVVDEAYGAFAEESAIPLLREHAHLVVVRTFSKSHGLAGLRVGYALGHPDVIAILDKVRDSYNVDRLAQVGAQAALEDEAYTTAILGKVCRNRDHYLAEFSQRGWFTYPSQANFLFVEPFNAKGERGKAVVADLFEFLKERKILVRIFPRHVLTESFVRISIGTEEDMETLHDALADWTKRSG